MSALDYTIRFLGTGTSIGIPVPGCPCSVCHSKDWRNHRSRSSIIIEKEGYRALIDTTPEFRFQALRSKINSLDAVFWTHAHADHLHGIDDLRGLTWNRPIPGYANPSTTQEIHRRFDYLWKNTQRGGGKARINLHEVNKDQSIHVGPLEFTPLPVLHGQLPIYGWRCGPIAYITDVSQIPTETYERLENLELLILGALRFKEHPTHFSVHRALEEVKKIRPKRAYFTHISHEASHRELRRRTPAHVNPARDGLRLRVKG
ncbi:MAG: MBL fold metallo-hydrolase [Spirochaetales bacterium]|nr:MBL fold metallo-hydrolase [Spirochaetales bacterium]